MCLTPATRETVLARVAIILASATTTCNLAILWHGHIPLLSRTGERLIVPLLVALALMTVGSLVALSRASRRRDAKLAESGLQLCPTCRYPTPVGESVRCPECGREVAPRVFPWIDVLRVRTELLIIIIGWAVFIYATATFHGRPGTGGFNLEGAATRTPTRTPTIIIMAAASMSCFTKSIIWKGASLTQIATVLGVIGAIPVALMSPCCATVP